MGALAETALVTQYLHAPVLQDLCFALWKEGEVDLVRLDPVRQQPLWALDVKWSDSASESGSSWARLLQFAAANRLDTVFMTSRTVSRTMEQGGVRRVVLPLPMLCFEIGTLAASQELLRDRYGLPAANG